MSKGGTSRTNNISRLAPWRGPRTPMTSCSTLEPGARYMRECGSNGKARREKIRPSSCPALPNDLALAFLRRARSEEHTSELQSLMRISYAVFCLKKKKKHILIQNNVHVVSQQ